MKSKLQADIGVAWIFLELLKKINLKNLKNGSRLKSSLWKGSICFWTLFRTFWLVLIIDTLRASTPISKMLIVALIARDPRTDRFRSIDLCPSSIYKYLPAILSFGCPVSSFGIIDSHFFLKLFLVLFDTCNFSSFATFCIFVFFWHFIFGIHYEQFEKV